MKMNHMFVRSASLAMILALQGTVAVSGQDKAKPYGIDERIPWTTSRVQGFPDAPPPFIVERVYPNLTVEKPLGIWGLPGSDQLLTCQHDSDWGGPGRILRFADDPAVSETSVFLERPEIIYGLAFHPRFEENGWLFVGCNGRSDALDTVATRVLRFYVDREPPYRCDPESCQVVIEWPSNGHNGGDVTFGSDGMLYISAGDGTSDSDTLLNGQDLSTLPGSILRIDVDTVSDDQPSRLYSVPKDNPFVDTEGARPEIWAYGLRNPWRITFDSATNQLWAGNNGQDWWESVHLIRRGENYGWSVMEGGHAFQLARERGPTPIIEPTVEHHHSVARSLTGGRVYHGSRLPQLQGSYIYGDYSSGNIWSVKHDGTQIQTQQLLARSMLQITGFGIDHRGELVVVDHGGGFYSLVPNEDEGINEQFPKRLSETGLFAEVAEHQVQPALIPYSVNSPLWSDGAAKERFIAVPGQETVTFSPNGSWSFPPGTVLVKTFSLNVAEENQTDEGKLPEHPRRIETRLLVNEQGQWYGYSYQWNESQTDAELIPDEGKDQTYLTRNEINGKISEQVWRFPSRTECMVCHTRQAGFVLGLSTPQLNRDHDYGTVTDNQLRTLEHIGLFTQKKLPKPPEKLRKLVDPHDASASLESRVRSYLDANCASCHVPAGGGNSQMILANNKKLDAMMILDVAPQHDKFGRDNARIVSSGDPDQSILLYRMSIRGLGQMPPLGTNRVDEQALQLIEEWIRSLED